MFMSIGGVLSPRNSDTPSLTESMQMVDEILSDERMDRFEKIEKLEAILSAVTGSPNDRSVFIEQRRRNADEMCMFVPG